MGPAARAHLRQDVPALVRGLPRARLAAAGRGVQAALRAPVDDGAHAVRARPGPAPGASSPARVARPGAGGGVRARGRAGGALRARELGRRRLGRRARGEHGRDGDADAKAEEQEEEARGTDACHPADRAHRSRQRVPRRRQWARADRQPGPGRPAGTAGATAASASASRSATATRGCERASGRSTCPTARTPVGYDVRPGKRPSELSEARRPTCL